MSQTTVFSRPRKADPAILERLRRIPVANISDVMWRLSGGGAALRPMHSGRPMAGIALTVRTRPGDNLFVHKALDMAVPGDVIVVDAGGDLTNAIIGELMTSYAATRGIAGLVIHGAIRDLDVIAKGPLPVYASGVSHRGPYKDGPGQINVPIALDGMVIMPGDIMLGDADGVLCVPADQAASICQAGEDKHAQEQQTLADIAAGVLDTRWVDAMLRQRGFLPE